MLQPRASVLRPGEHTVGVGGVLAGERLQLRLAAEHAGQPLGVGVQPVQVGGELPRDVVELREHVAEHGVQRGQCVVAGAAQAMAGLSHECHCTEGRLLHRIPAGDRGPRGTGRLAQVVRGGQPACLLRQIPVLARLRVDRLDLGEAVPQQVRLLRQPTRAVAPLDELDSYRLPLGAHGPVPLQRRAHGVAGEPVEQRPLLGGPQQPQLVVLPVHRERGVGQPGQHADGHRAPAQVRPRAPVRADGPHGDQRTVVVRLGADLVRHRQRRRVRREPALHHGPPRPVRHPATPRRARRRAA